jgi:5'-3' exonuclease
VIRIYDCNNHVRLQLETGLGVRDLYNRLSTMATLDPVFFVWDGKNANARRRAIYPDYKGNRGQVEQSIFAAFDMLKHLLQLSAGTTIICDGWEADDVIATLCTRHMPNDTIHIHSTDQDFFQLPNVTLDSSKPIEKPEFVRLYKTMVRDASDNIKGIKQFGKGGWDKIEPVTRHELILGFESGEARSPAFWAQYDRLFSPASRNWLTKQENVDQLWAYWQIVGFYDVPDDEIKPVTGTHLPHEAWKIMNDLGL